MHVGRIRLRAGQLVAVPLMDMLLFVAVKRLVLRIVSQIAGKNLIGLITMISSTILTIFFKCFIFLLSLSLLFFYTSGLRRT